MRRGADIDEKKQIVKKKKKNRVSSIITADDDYGKHDNRQTDAIETHHRVLSWHLAPGALRQVSAADALKPRSTPIDCCQHRIVVRLRCVCGALAVRLVFPVETLSNRVPSNP